MDTPLRDQDWLLLVITDMGQVALAGEQLADLSAQALGGRYFVQSRV